jgi:hypothetical protein
MKGRSAMKLLSVSEILQKISTERERLIALGVSNERQEEYYRRLSVDCSDPDMDQRAFASATAGLDLSAEDLRFIRKALDDGDGR